MILNLFQIYLVQLKMLEIFMIIIQNYKKNFNILLIFKIK